MEPPLGREFSSRPGGGQMVPVQPYFGALADSTLMVPATMSALSLSTSAFSSGDTLLSKVLYGANETPLFSSVPR